MANSEAIAWYVEESQRLLEDRQRRAESLQTRAGVRTVIAASYLTDPFLDAPDLWRVHVRSLRSLKKATDDAQERGNDALKSITVSLYAFLAGLAFAVVAVALLTVESI